MEALTRKVGGLPVWAWAGILVVGYIAYRHYAAAKAAAASTTAEQQVLANAFGNITGAPYAGWQGGASSPGQGDSGTSPGSGSGAPGTTTSVTTGAAGTVLATPTPTAPVMGITPQAAALASVQANSIPPSTPPPTPQATIGTGPESQAITATANTNTQDAYWAHRLPFTN